MTEFVSGDFALRDMAREPAPAPCPDCGRSYLNGENITISVPTPDGGTRIPWSGCVDCWLVRSRPGDADLRARWQAEAGERIAQAIESTRNRHWQMHLATHPHADGTSDPRCYATHDALYVAAKIARDDRQEQS